METKRYLLITTVLILLVGGSVSAQIIHGTPVSGGLEGQFTSWTITDPGDNEQTVTQITVPFSGLIPLKDNLEMTYYIVNSSNSFEAGTLDYSLNGLSNLSLQISQAISEDHLLLSGGISLPTGKKELDVEGQAVLQVLSQNFLQMPMRQFGEGFGFNVILGAATAIGENGRGGAGISYRYNGSYAPYEGVDDYNPGDAVNINAGVDFGTDSARFSIEAIYATFGTDQLDGTDVFKQSDQIDMRVSGVKAANSVTWSGLVRYLVRGDNEQYDSSGTALEAFQFYGNEFAVNGAALFRLGETFHAGPTATYRSIAESDAAGSSSVIGGGIMFNSGLSESVALHGGFTYYTGDADGGDLDLTGYSATLGLSAGL